MSKQYKIITYGCQMNVHESEKLAGMLVKAGFVEADCKENADIIVLNTCCIRETAESHILGNLGVVKKLKELKPELIVAVCGCMTQQKDAAEKLKKRCPFINIIFGTHNLHLFGEYLDALSERKTIIDIWESEQEITEDTPLYRTSGVNAWVNIMYGCNNFCSYCIVPHVRGRERSRDIDKIFADVHDLVNSGYKEITLLGQNVNSFGNDLGNPEINFAALLSRLGKIDAKFRIKFMTSHPKDLSEKVVRVMAEHNNISKFIHLPIQAGSDRILELMNRKYTSKDYLHKIDTIRKFMPDAGISTDIMVGFPTETEDEFLQTLNLVEKVKFNNIYSFIYSKRNGTKAAVMDGQIDYSTKQNRIKRLIDSQFEIGKKISKGLIGKTFEVLCDSFDNGRSSGKTDCGKSVSFLSDKNLIGQFVNVKITGSKNTNLKGELI